MVNALLKQDKVWGGVAVCISLCACVSVCVCVYLEALGGGTPWRAALSKLVEFAEALGWPVYFPRAQEFLAWLAWQQLAAEGHPQRGLKAPGRPEKGKAQGQAQQRVSNDGPAPSPPSTPRFGLNQRAIQAPPFHRLRPVGLSPEAETQQSHGLLIRTGLRLKPQSTWLRFYTHYFPGAEEKKN